jgi:RND family efflux transporter MFP subunit
MTGRVLRSLTLLIALSAAAWGSRYPLIWVKALQRPSADAAPSVAVDTTRALRGMFSLNVTASGKLRARTTASVRMEQLEGKLLWIAADSVPIKKGDLLARLDDTELKRQVRDIGLEYENARAEIEKSGRDLALEQRNSKAAVDKANEERRILDEANKVQLKQAQDDVNFRNAELERLTTEYKRKQRQEEEHLVPKADLEAAEISMRSAAFAADKSQKDLNLQVEKAKSTVQQKETELENARVTMQTSERRQRDDAEASKTRLETIKLRLDDAKRKLDWCTIHAPASGLVVLAKDWHPPDNLRVARPGDEMRPYSAIADIPDLSVMAVDCKVPEREIGAVHPGQSVLVRLDERPTQPYHGSVLRISSVADVSSPWDDTGFDVGTKVFTVTIELKERDPKRLVPGMNATIEITTRSIPNAVYVLKNCVFDRGSDHVVYVQHGQSFQAVPVVVGEENDKSVCIRSGLKGGERIATEDPTRAGSTEQS